MSKVLKTAAEVVGVVVSIAAAIPSGGTSLLATVTGLSTSSALAIGGAISPAVSRGSRVRRRRQ